jgi:ABC-2 type transport system permease protein
MIRLTKVELRRLFSRRLTCLVLLGALAVTGVMLVSTFMDARPPSSSELTVQRTFFDQAHKDWVVNGAQQVKDCLAAQAEAQKTDPTASLSCGQQEPTLASFEKPQAKFIEKMPLALLGGAYLLTFVGFLIGVSFVAAEFSSGSMATWLTFEPQRTRVFASKIAAVALGLLPLAVALLGLLTAGVWLIVKQLGSTAGTTAAVWGDLGATGARSVALVLAATVSGAVLGVLLRRTAAVLGVVVGYVVLVEVVLRGSLQGAQPWLLQPNVSAWLEHGTRYFVNRCATGASGSFQCESVQKALTFSHSSVYLGVLVLLAVGMAALVFRRRDVS